MSKLFYGCLNEQISGEKRGFFFEKVKIVLRNKKMFKKQLEDLSLKNQPLMDKFVTLKPKLERVALPTPTHRNPFDDPGVRRESVKKPPKPPSPERSKSASVRSRSAPVHKSMTYMQKLAICRMDEQYLRARVITWAIEKYGSGNSTIRKVLDQGASYYQKLVNLGHGNECRQVEGTCYAAGMAIADEELRVLHADNCVITKAMVLEKLRVAMTLNLPNLKSCLVLQPWRTGTIFSCGITDGGGVGTRAAHDWRPRICKQRLRTGRGRSVRCTRHASTSMRFVVMRRLSLRRVP